MTYSPACNVCDGVSRFASRTKESGVVGHHNRFHLAGRVRRAVASAWLKGALPRHVRHQRS